MLTRDLFAVADVLVKRYQ